MIYNAQCAKYGGFLLINGRHGHKDRLLVTDKAFRWLAVFDMLQDTLSPRRSSGRRTKTGGMVYERELDLMYRSFEEVGMLLRCHTDIMERHVGTLTTATMLLRKNVTVCGMSKAAREGDKRKGRDIQLLSDIHESLRCLSQREVCSS